MEITIDKITPGLIIEKPIQDGKGRTVVKVGTSLTPLLIKRLNAWGIKKITVKGDDKPESKKEEAKPAAPAEKKVVPAFDKELVVRIAKKFTKVREDPLMDKIMRLAIKNLSENKSK